MILCKSCESPNWMIHRCHLMVGGQKCQCIHCSGLGDVTGQLIMFDSHEITPSSIENEINSKEKKDGRDSA